MKQLGAMYKRGITSSTLKYIAIITMIVDHIGAIFIEKVLIQGGILEVTSQQSYDIFMENYHVLYSFYEILRSIGRMSFPIFCFLVVQGFLHTHDVKKYLKRMFLFALLSEIPFDLAFSNRFFDWEYQNVFFTLFFGILTMACIDKVKERVKWERYALTFLIVSLCLCIVYALRSDYDMLGILVIVLMYLFRRNKMLSSILGCSVLMEVFAFASLLPIQLYNGKKGKSLKYVFYLFYPLHLLVFHFFSTYI